MRQVERTPLGVWAGELSSEVCDRIIEEGKVLAQQIATINKDNNIFYTLSFKESNVNSNISSYEIKRSFKTMKISKRINLND